MRRAWVAQEASVRGATFASWLGPGNGPDIATRDGAREILKLGAARRRDSDCGAAAYGADNSLTGRTSTLPTRAGGIFDANWIASFKSLASIR